MPYIDFFLAPVPRENKAAYEELARLSSKVLLECGALRVMECWLDESGPEASSYHAADARLESSNYEGFAKAAGAREGETVVASYVEWPSKAARDSGMQKFTSDPRMQLMDLPPTFDGQRLVAGGFTPIPGPSDEALPLPGVSKRSET